MKKILYSISALTLASTVFANEPNALGQKSGWSTKGDISSSTDTSGNVFSKKDAIVSYTTQTNSMHSFKITNFSGSNDFSLIQKRLNDEITKFNKKNKDETSAVKTSGLNTSGLNAFSKNAKPKVTANKSVDINTKLTELIGIVGKIDANQSASDEMVKQLEQFKNSGKSLDDFKTVKDAYDTYKKADGIKDLKETDANYKELVDFTNKLKGEVGDGKKTGQKIISTKIDWKFSGTGFAYMYDKVWSYAKLGLLLGTGTGTTTLNAGGVIDFNGFISPITAKIETKDTLQQIGTYFNLRLPIKKVTIEPFIGLDIEIGSMEVVKSTIDTTKAGKSIPIAGAVANAGLSVYYTGQKIDVELTHKVFGNAGVTRMSAINSSIASVGTETSAGVTAKHFDNVDIHAKIAVQKLMDVMEYDNADTTYSVGVRYNF